MTALLIVASVLAGQVHALGAAWTHPALPDPFVVLAAFVGLFAPRRALPWAAVGLGWGRALVTLQPAGAEVLCVGLALLVVASQREAFERDRPSTLFFVALLATGAHAVGAWALSACGAAEVGGGLALLTGSLLAMPLARPARRVARGVGWIA